MSRFIAKAIVNGTSLTLQASGNSVDSAYKHVVRNPLIKRHSCVILFFSRRTGKLVDSRMN